MCITITVETPDLGSDLVAYRGTDRSAAAAELRKLRASGIKVYARVTIPGTLQRRMRLVPGSQAARAMTAARFRVWARTPRAERRA